MSNAKSITRSMPQFFTFSSLRTQRYLRHFILIFGLLITLAPIIAAFLASTHDQQTLLDSGITLAPGTELITNYSEALSSHRAFGGVPLARLLLNSFIVALGIALGKIAISFLSAFALVFFRFPARMFFFWVILMTLMLPVEVRIVPTFQIVANLGLLNSYQGLILPLITSATATLLFRQFFTTVPKEMVDAARIDGAGPLRFMTQIMLPLSRNNIAALFVIMFIYGWNQYLWPLLITNSDQMYTIVIGINRMLSADSGVVNWPVVMASTIIAILPPVVIIFLMQKQFVKGLIESDK